MHGNRIGINASLALATGAPLTIRDNIIRDNTEYGLLANSNNTPAIVITGNKVYGQSGPNDVGMFLAHGTVATGNQVYNNFRGIQSVSNDSAFLTRVSDNRLFNNSNVGISVEGKVIVDGNSIYSNAVGLYAAPGSFSTVTNNVIYANTNRGIWIQNVNSPAVAEYLNNTIYQPVGDGIRLDNSSRNNRIVNNIVWVLSGYGIFVANDSQTGFQSDYNLFPQSADPNAFVGSWNGTNRDLLADWRTATTQDANSLEGSPGFVDIDGADNVLGYVATGSGINGGLDDNFYRTKNSLAIDRGQSWGSPRTDIEGFGRSDDAATANQGSNRYLTSSTGRVVYAPASVGTAQNWNADDQAWSLALPFAFPFYDASYTSVFVSSNGLLQFGSATGAESPTNSGAALRATRRIAPLWDDLTTIGTGDNIFVDSSVSNQVTIRWNATNKIDGRDVQFAVVLTSAGGVQFHYGTSNFNMTPTVGVSSGNVDVFTLSSYDGQTNLENVNSVAFTKGVGVGVVNMTMTNLTTNGFYSYTTRGTPQNWKADDAFWIWTLPFAFSFYGTSYTTVNVSSNGFLQFGSTNLANNPVNTSAELMQTTRIAALWDDLTTTGATDNIFIDTSVAGQATVRWDATNKANNGDVNFSITLFATGAVRTEYGPGNKQLTPTVGISRGNNRDYDLFSDKDGKTVLTNVSPNQSNIVKGIVDIGAYEFRGNSSDNVPPQIVASTPAAIQSNGVVAMSIADVRLTFSEEINPIDARSSAAYELRGAGANGLFNDADDVVYAITASYAPGQNTVVLVPTLSGSPLPGGSLPDGSYRVTVLANVTSSIHDLAGNRLDGNADGTEGGNFVRQFKVITNSMPQLAATNPLPQIQNDQSDAANPGMLVSALIAAQVTDPDGPASGVAIASAASTAGTWQYALDGITFEPIQPKLAGGKRLLLAADADTRIRFKPNAGFTGAVSDLLLSAWDRADELAEGLDVLESDLSAQSIGDQTAAATVSAVAPNVAPTDMALSNSTILENLAAGATVGTLASTDPNSGDTHTYQLVAGSGSTDNAQFDIVAGVLKTKSQFDFETKATYSIRVRSTDQSGLSFEKALSISVADMPELVSGPVIGNGTASRSVVRQVTVTLDGAITIDTGAFSVVKRGASGGPVTTTATPIINGQGQTVITLTFSGAFTHGGALDDGYYELTIDGTKLTRAGRALDINQDGTEGDSLVLGANEADNFFALYGDTNGDGVVGVSEFGQFRSSFGKTSTDAGYNAQFDYESDGAVGVGDFGQFRSRFGKPKLQF